MRMLVIVVISLLALPLYAQKLAEPDRYNGDKYELPVTLHDAPGSWSNYTLTDKLRCEKDDNRTDFRQIGIRPALVFLVQMPPFEKGNMEAVKKVQANSVNAVKMAEAIAVKQPEIELWVVFANRDMLPTPEGMKGAGIKQTVVAIAEMGYSLCENVPGLRFTYMERETNQRFVATAGDDKNIQFYYEWIWMPRPAKVTATGDEIDDNMIADLLKKAKDEYGTILRDRKGEQFIKAAAVGNYKAAGKILADLRTPDKAGKCPGSDELIGALDTLVMEIEGVMRDFCIARCIKGFYFAEAGEMLEGLVEMTKLTSRNADLAKELAAVKAKPEYKACVDARPVFEKLKRKWDAIIVPFDDAHDTVKLHYEKILKAYTPLKPEVEAFQKKFKGVGYFADTGKWMSMLADAETRIKKEEEAGK